MTTWDNWKKDAVTPEDEPHYVEQGGHMFSYVCQKPHNHKYQEQCLTQTWGTGFHLGEDVCGCVYIRVCTGIQA